MPCSRRRRSSCSATSRRDGRCKAEISEADVLRVKPGQAGLFQRCSARPTSASQARSPSVEPAPDTLKTPECEANSSLAGNSSSSAATTTAVYYNALFEVPNTGRARCAHLMTAQVTDRRRRARGRRHHPLGRAPAPRRRTPSSTCVDGDGRPTPRRVAGRARQQDRGGESSDGLKARRAGRRPRAAPSGPEHDAAPHGARARPSTF